MSQLLLPKLREFLNAVAQITEVQNLLGTGNNTICTKIYCTFNWWLRSPGNLPHDAACVLSNGRLLSNGMYVGNGYGVLPALWLNY